MEETDVVVKALSQLLLGDQAQRISTVVPQVVQVGEGGGERGAVFARR